MNQEIILKAEQISKQYRLGLIGTGTISHDLNRWWYRIRGKEDPYLRVGEVNNRATKAAESDYVWALQDINFDVMRGEVLGIIGKNGAGKSTLLKILAKVTSPTHGEIKTKGRIASLLEVGTGFHGEMTGRENIFLNGAILGMTKKEINSKIDEIIEFSGCQRYIDTPVKRYSSGMTVRLAFAVAAFLEPEILVVDEVLAVGDVEFQQKAIGKMQDISQGEGRTVLFVSHNMAAVKSLCTRAIVLDQGKIHFEGNTNEAVNFYLENAQNKSLLSIAEREDRKGNGKLTIKSIYVENTDGVKVGELNSGEGYHIFFEYEKNQEIDIKQFTIVVQIYNEQDELVTTIATDEQGTVFNRISDVGAIEIRINRLQLREGKYSVKYMISEKFAFNTPHKVIDNLENAYILNVIRGDYWHSGVLNRPKGFIQESSIHLTSSR